MNSRGWLVLEVGDPLPAGEESLPGRSFAASLLLGSGIMGLCVPSAAGAAGACVAAREEGGRMVGCASSAEIGTRGDTLKAEKDDDKEKKQSEEDINNTRKNGVQEGN